MVQRKQSEADRKPRGKRADTLPETPDPPVSPIDEKPPVDVLAGVGKAFPEREPVEGVTQRLSFGVTELGVLDVDSIKKRGFAERAKEVVKKSMLDPHVRQWAGVSDSAAAIPLPVPPATIGFIFDLVSKVETSYFAKKLSITKEADIARAFQIVKLDEKEHEMIDAQGAQLIQKYVPAHWLEAADIWIFASTLVGLQVMKYQMLVSMFGKPNDGLSESGPLAEKNRKPNGSAGVAAIPVSEAEQAS